MDIAPDTLFAALPALLPASGSATGIQNPQELNKPNQSFGELLKSEIEGESGAIGRLTMGILSAEPVAAEVPGGSEPTATEVKREGTSAAALSADTGNTLPPFTDELAPVDAKREEAIPADQTDGEEPPKEVQLPSSPYTDDSNRPPIATAAVAATVVAPPERSAQASHLADTRRSVDRLQPDGAQAPRAQAADTGVNSGERVLPPASPDDNQWDNQWTFRAIDTSVSQPGNKPELTADTLSTIDSRPSGENLNLRAQEPPSALQTLLNASVTTPKPVPVAVTSHNLTDPGWPDAFGEKINWLVGKGEQSATIQLAPEELGKLQLRITVNQGVTQIEVHARNQNTADLMESMLPKLQASLENHGIRMDEVKFSQQPLAMMDHDRGQGAAQQFSRQTPNESGTPLTADAELPDPGLLAFQTGLMAPVGVDYYA